MRIKLIAANWKMHKTVDEAVNSAKSMLSTMPRDTGNEVVICAPFTALYALKEVLKGTSIKWGAQNMYFEEKGAFTGEIAPAMLKELDCSYVIIGHSERREIFGEEDDLLNKKLKAAFAHNITPILCVGESLAVREKGEEIAYIEGQLEKDLAGLTKEQVASMVIAYEPIWAIGTGRTASSQQAEAMCAAIRNFVERLYSHDVAESVRIQYGGSVKGTNAKEILQQPNIDGALVGGAALTAESFMPIVEA